MSRPEHLLQIVTSRNGYHLDSASFISHALQANGVVVRDVHADNLSSLKKELDSHHFSDCNVILHEPSEVTYRDRILELLSASGRLVRIGHFRETGSEDMTSNSVRIVSIPAFCREGEAWLPLYGPRTTRTRPSGQLAVIVSGSSSGDEYAAETMKTLSAMNHDVYHFGMQASGPIESGEQDMSIPEDVLRRASLVVCTDESLSAGIFICYALHWDIPVIALESTASKQLLGSGGMILKNCEATEMVSCISAAIANPELRSKIRAGQREQLGRGMKPAEIGQRLLQHVLNDRTLSSVDKQVRQKKYLVEGPFDSTYSLAILNRELARAMRAHGLEVSLSVSPAEGSYYGPPPSFAATQADIMKLWAPLRTEFPDVVLRDTYPPTTEAMDGLYNIYHSYGWEESAYPEEFVRSFNQSLNLITTLSSYVTKTLIDNGITVPVVTTACGVSVCNSSRTDMPVLIKKGFMFLHVSSCFPRKGVDVLLNAFSSAFYSHEDVCLVIKTFPNIHNDVGEMIRELTALHPDTPEIILINRDVSEESLAALYQRADVIVAPSRGEGFGLPLAEAFLHDKPVIATAHGGPMDFLSPDNSWLVDYKFERAKSHMNLYDSVWADPDTDHLADQMRRAFETPPDVRKKMASVGKQVIENHFSWARIAAANVSAIKALQSKPPQAPPRVAWFSTWNAKCGISTYSASLLRFWPHQGYHILARVELEKTSPDDSRVTRCWRQKNVDFPVLINSLKEFDCLVVQYHPAFFDIKELARICTESDKMRVPVYIFCHNTGFLRLLMKDPERVKIVSSIKKARRIFVHSVSGLNQFKDLGLTDNLTLFPHGTEPVDGTDATSHADGRITIASYGFFLKHKGLLELIHAVNQLRKRHDIRLLLVNAVHPQGRSAEIYEKCLKAITTLGIQDSVTMITDFLPDTESLRYLESADIIIFPYQYSEEGASGAVRFGLRANRVVACTPLSIFDDISDAVTMLPGTSPSEIARGISHLIDNRKRWPTQIERQNQWVASHTWEKLSHRLLNVLYADLQWLRWGAGHSRENILSVSCFSKPEPDEY